MVLVPKGAVVKTGCGLIGLLGTRLSLRLSQVPGDGWTLSRGLPPTTVEGLSPSPPIPPTLGEGGGGKMDGTAYQDLPGLVWEQSLGMAMIGNFPVGGRLSLFLLA